MVHAFIMVKTGAGQAAAAIDGIRGVDAVTEAHIVAGEFDIIAEVTTEEVYEVLETVASAIQGLEGVVDTKTYVALD